MIILIIITIIIIPGKNKHKIITNMMTTPEQLVELLHAQVALPPQLGRLLAEPQLGVAGLGHNTAYRIIVINIIVSIIVITNNTIISLSCQIIAYCVMLYYIVSC